jgi:hypothetical protein
VIQEVMKKMKKTMIAALAALMLAGTLSAVGGVTSSGSAIPIIVVGEGSAPIPLTLPTADTKSDPSSLANKF